MTSLIETYEQFNPTFAAYNASTDDLGALERSNSSASTEASFFNKSTPFGLFFRTMGKLNHTFESSESLSSMHGSQNSLSSRGSNSNFSFFDTMEKLTIQQCNSTGSLSNYGDTAMIRPADTPMQKFFIALQEFLGNKPNAEGGEDDCEPENEGADTIFPKLC